MDVAKIEAAITPRTKAIVVVHLHGLAVDMDAILSVARRHNLTAPFADAVACGADPEIVAAVHQSLERGDGIDAALDRLRAGCSR